MSKAKELQKRVYGVNRESFRQFWKPAPERGGSAFSATVIFSTTILKEPTDVCVCVYLCGAVQAGSVLVTASVQLPTDEQASHLSTQLRCCVATALTNSTTFAAAGTAQLTQLGDARGDAVAAVAAADAAEDDDTDFWVLVVSCVLGSLLFVGSGLAYWRWARASVVAPELLPKTPPLGLLEDVAPPPSYVSTGKGHYNRALVAGQWGAGVGLEKAYDSEYRGMLGGTLGQPPVTLAGKANRAHARKRAKGGNALGGLADRLPTLPTLSNPFPALVLPTPSLQLRNPFARSTRTEDAAEGAAPEEPMQALEAPPMPSILPTGV